MLELLLPFLPSCFHRNICEWFNFSHCSFRVNMNKNSVKCSKGINLSQLTLAEKTKVKNLGNATCDLVISQSSSTRIQTYMRQFNPTIYAKRKWLMAVLKEMLY